MSKSRSPTPTSNLSTNPTAVNIAPSPKPTPSTSRRHPIETSSSRPAEENDQPPASTHLSIPETHYEQHSSHLVRRADSPLEGPMAKRYRRESPEAKSRPDARSSPSSDSQDGMADNEMDFKRGERTEPLPPSASPPKKKRTRTLTTPHQSAVLHALLAQSRFPTTAMREEVGRSIGLSARKVQNQRQKARRPQSQGETPSRPPQYGPFPTPPEPTPVGAFPPTTGTHGGRDYEETRPDRARYGSQSHQVPEGHLGPLDTPPRLLGPGVPGSVPSYGRRIYHRVRPQPSIPESPSDLGHPRGYMYPTHATPRLFPSPPMHMHRPPSIRPATSQPRGWRDRDFSRTLPPLTSSRPATSAFGARPRRVISPSPRLNPLMPPFNPPRSLSPEIRFAHHPPDLPRRSSMDLPPPFTLQPRPQWDDPAYSPVPGPSSSGWSRAGSRTTVGRLSSPRAFFKGVSAAEAGETSQNIERTPRLIPALSEPLPPLPLRSGRYDPVRSIFIPFTTPTASPELSPSQRGDDRSHREQSREAP
ncbi:hypothetical protein K443DRAFT_130851 [Laccaria amethystina LaAM-08-1]|uniref:Homeobox domain-containing protein n=1 Tax=Laccaria amethystina LaAM-08-1 TaxID=1095629 RepID=A0A0C9Y940_9AGAR|nr:hypothetical protein K443DRAFT_130851 [Laccaria amethystina LaAM-08-1]